MLAKTPRRPLATPEYVLTPPPPCLPLVNQYRLTSEQKAEAAAQKKAVEDSRRAADEDKEWSKGAKSNSKKYVNRLHFPPEGRS